MPCSAYLTKSRDLMHPFKPKSKIETQLLQDNDIIRVYMFLFHPTSVYNIHV